MIVQGKKKLQPMLSLTRMNSLANDSSRFSMGDLVNGFSS